MEVRPCRQLFDGTRFAVLTLVLVVQSAMVLMISAGEDSHRPGLTATVATDVSFKSKRIMAVRYARSRRRG